MGVTSGGDVHGPTWRTVRRCGTDGRQRGVGHVVKGLFGALASLGLLAGLLGTAVVASAVSMFGGTGAPSVTPAASAALLSSCSASKDFACFARCFSGSSRLV